jgi:hypothetical protein
MVQIRYMIRALSYCRYAAGTRSTQNAVSWQLARVGLHRIVLRIGNNGGNKLLMTDCHGFHFIS